MGQRDGLSQYDILKLGRMYECDKKPASGFDAIAATINNSISSGRFEFGRQLFNTYTSPQFWQRLFHTWFYPQSQPQIQPQRRRNYYHDYGYLSGFAY